VTQAKVTRALAKPWVAFNVELMKLTEAEVRRALDHEKTHRRRLTVILRLHSRLNRLRRERERNELAKLP
jgi:hypothetical protein